jgi:hypothetical protein
MGVFVFQLKHLGQTTLPELHHRLANPSVVLTVPALNAIYQWHEKPFYLSATILIHISPLQFSLLE